MRQVSDMSEAAAGSTEKFDINVFVVQRLDRIETHLDGEIGQVRNEIGQVRNEMGQLRNEVGQVRDGMNARFDNLRMWTFGMIVTVIIGFAAVVVTLVAKG